VKGPNRYYVLACNVEAPPPFCVLEGPEIIFPQQTGSHFGDNAAPAKRQEVRWKGL
jgi:hypothetical protein